jgi:lactoylglutathione lyase
MLSHEPFSHQEAEMKFCWATINVKDMGKSVQFYKDVIGLPLDRLTQAGPDMELAFLGAGETQIELIYNAKAGTVNIGPDICLGFTVDSLDKTAGFLKSKNIPVHSGPFQPNPSIKFLYVLDPNGLKIQFVENIKAK